MILTRGGEIEDEFIFDQPCSNANDYLDTYPDNIRLDNDMLSLLGICCFSCLFVLLSVYPCLSLVGQCWCQPCHNGPLLPLQTAHTVAPRSPQPQFQWPFWSSSTGCGAGLDLSLEPHGIPLQITRSQRSFNQFWSSFISSEQSLQDSNSASG